MIKEYIAVSNGANGMAAQDIDFVESFWTRKFLTENGLAARNDITSTDEYRLMQPYLYALPSGARILDGGCGAGEWTITLSRRGYSVTGFDISEAIVAALKTRFAEQDFVRGDLRKTEFPDASLDLYFAWGAIEHFETGPGPYLSEAFRILKSGGMIFVSVPYANRRINKQSSEGVLLPSKAEQVSSGNSSSRFYQWRFTRSELQLQMEQAGFSVLDVRPIHKLEGIGRMFLNDLGIELKPQTFLGNLMTRILGFFIPDDYVCHMIVGIGRRP